MSEDKGTKTPSGRGHEALLAGLLTAMLVSGANLVGGLTSEVLPVDRTWCASGLLLLGMGVYQFRTGANSQQKNRAFVLMGVGVAAVVTGFFV